MIILLFFGQIIILTGCSGKVKNAEKPSAEIKAFELILDLNKIIGKSMKEVNSVLGEPETVQEFYAPSGKSLNRTEAIYKGNKFEIMFNFNKASVIYINNTPNLTNDVNALQKLGMENQTPTSITPNKNTSWENVGDISLITCFKNHIFIKVTDQLPSE